MSISISIGILLNMDMGVAADLIRDLDLIWDTDLSGDLAGVLDWLLVALPVLLGMALRSSGVSRLSLSISSPLAISISTMSMRHNLGVMTNNSRAVVNLVGGFLAVLCDNILAFLNIGSVNNDIILLVASLLKPAQALYCTWYGSAFAGDHKQSGRHQGQPGQQLRKQEWRQI